MPDAHSLILVVDDDASVRRSLSRLLRSAGWTVETYATAEEFLARPADPGVGCLILDVRMPGMQGPELRDRLAARRITWPIIFLTGHGDIPMSVDAMKRGAVDFLVKPVDENVLLPAVAAAVERQRAQRAAARELDQIYARVARLSDREREVMEYVIGGFMNKQIAEALGISEKTVKVHRSRVMAKMAVNSVAELVHLYQTANIRSRPAPR
jgi:RNA polymerase sigma factor (sigma-70 family)